MNNIEKNNNLDSFDKNKVKCEICDNYLKKQSKSTNRKIYFCSEKCYQRWCHEFRAIDNGIFPVTIIVGHAAAGKEICFCISPC